MIEKYGIDKKSSSIASKTEAKVSLTQFAGSRSGRVDSAGPNGAIKWVDFPAADLPCPSVARDSVG